MNEVDVEPVLPPTDAEKSAVKELLALNPELLVGAEAYVTRVMPPKEVAPRMSPEDVQAEIDRACGRNLPPPAPDRMTVKIQELKTQYEAEVAKREQDAATARARAIFDSVQPKPEE